MRSDTLSRLIGLLFPLVAAGSAVAGVEANFDYGCEPRSGSCSNLTVHVDGSASTSTEGDIVGYRWYFRRYLKEDNESQYGTATGVRATHTYTVVRCRNYTFFATLEVTDSLGNKASHTKQIDPSRRIEQPPQNQGPVANFSVASDFLDCFFDAGDSYDPDGIIVSYAWDLGDGNTATGEMGLHAYAEAGTYVVRLTVTDDEGAVASKSQSITVVAEPLPGFNLTATGRRVGGLQKVDLSWTGAVLEYVDVYRNGDWIATTPNDGFFTDNINLRGRGTYIYQLCEEGTDICSNESTVVFD